MSRGMIVFTVAAGVAWAIMLVVSIHAVTAMGAAAAGDEFFGEFAHPWRAQFATDFSIHLVLVALWMLWRSRSWALGLVWAVLAINLGALFTLPFIVVAIWRAGGHLGPALLGARATPAAR